MQLRFDIRPSVRRDQIDCVRAAVDLYMAYAPNADLGEATPRENMRSAFYLIRSRVEGGWNFHGAAAELDRIAYSMYDM